MRKPFGPFLLCIVGLSACPVIAEPLTPEQRQQLLAMQQSYRYSAIVRAYADYMSEHGRDRYGEVHSPLFVSVMDRKTATVFTSWQVPQPYTGTKPYAPGLRRNHTMRPYDRTYSGSNPLQDLPLYGLLYRLSYPPWRRVFNVGFRIVCPVARTSIPTASQ